MYVFLMDKHGARMFALVFLTVCSNTVSGSNGMPANLKVSVLDGEVIAVWDPPTDVTSMARYSVQIAIYSDWMNVSSCTMIRTTLCDLTSLIHNYMAKYRVRVHTITANSVSNWTANKKFLPNDSELRPPSFTLSATSSSLAVTVHEKPILRKIFLFGMTYTIYMEERGQANETTMAYLNDDRKRAEGRTKTFRSLHWGREYCVRLWVVGNGALRTSNVSTRQCVTLPQPEWYVIAVKSLSVLGVLGMLAVIMSALCCFVRRPGKTPVALKSPKTGWTPLTVVEGTMEVVTDKGWLFSTPKAHAESWVNKEPTTQRENVRRTSMDSGVSVWSNGATKTGGCDPARQEDSGCVGFEGSRGTGSFSGGAAATEERHPRGGRTRVSAEGTAKDGGVRGLGSSEGQDSGFPAEQMHLAADQYRHQGSAAVRLSTRHGDEALKEIRVDPDRPPVDVATGYRKGQLSRAHQTNPGPWAGREGAGGDGNAELSEEERTFSTNYRRKTHIQMETVVSVDDSETPSNQLHVAFKEASAPLFLPLAFLPLARGDLGCAVNTVSISLSDVELWSE